MTMAVPVRIIRPNDMPRSCRDESGAPKTLFPDRKSARRTARLYRHLTPGLRTFACDHCTGYHLARPRAVRS